MNHLKTGNAFYGQGSYKNYKYNGKELQESGMYDYGARFYMPDLGRWGAVDPMAEKYTRMSPYSYVGNNPAIFVDYDGRDFGMSIDMKKGTITITGNYYALSRDMQAARGAVDKWNNVSGKYSYTYKDSNGVQKSLKVVFSLTTTEVKSTAKADLKSALDNNPINRIDPLGLTDYKVNGEIRTINDGHTNVTMNVTERQFNRLQKRFNKGGSSYERLMNRLSDRNGYTTFSANGSGVGDGFTITKHKPGEDSYGQWSIQNNHQTYGTVEHIARVTDSSLGSVTGQFGNINVGSNNKLYFRQNTGRIFNGNQYVRTVSAASKYSKLAKGAKWGGLATGVALGEYEIYQGVQQDGGTYGYNAQVQTGGAVGGLAGGLAGAEAGAAAGAAIGTFFGGVGAVPGGIIGGLIGGVAGAWGGDYYGEKAAKAIIE